MMLSLLSEVHFWTSKEDICISNSDFGAYRYHDKKGTEDSTASEGKKSYAEKRGHTWVLQNKRPLRMKENLKELEDQLLHQRMVFCQWRDCNLLQVMFCSGLFVNIGVNIFTGDLTSIVFDKFLVGKLLSDFVVDVVLTKSHLICSYNESQLTVVYFTKPSLKHSALKSFSRLDPRIQTIELAGPAGRRLERKLSCNVSSDMIVAWWPSSNDEVYPWSPIVKDQDRANVLVYGISGLKAELLCHHRSEFDLISVSFSQIHSNIVCTVEQKVSRNGDVTVESSLYSISRGSMQKTSAASIPLPTQVCCHSFSPLQDKLLLGCIDGSLVLYDEAQGVTHIVKAAFIPSLVSWHPDGGILVIANERCQLQILDAALATLKQQLLSEDAASSNLLDITSFFRVQPTLRTIQWSKKAETNFYDEKFAASDCFLLLLFERGPFAVLRFIGGGGLSGDIHGRGGFCIDSLVAQYLWTSQVDRAINLLLTLNWDIVGSSCLSCLQRIVNHLFKLPLTPDLEVQIQAALGSFHMPVRPMCPATVEEFKAPVRDLTRRFFHHLLRYKLFEKAFRLAIDLLDRDLFMDIHFSAKQAGKPEIANAAFRKAEEFDRGSYSSSTSGSSHSECSRSSCSECSDSDSIVSGTENQELVEGGHTSNSQSNVLKGLDLKDIFSPTLDTGSNTFHPHPPLPVLTGISKTPTGRKLNQSQTFVGNMKTIVTPPFERPSVSFLSKNYQEKPSHFLPSDSLDFINEKVSPTSLAQRTPAVQIERPKVKFCDTVTQITLPDHLHTLPEEEEDLQPVGLPQSLKTNSPVMLSHDCSLSQGGTQFSVSSFASSANSVGIPIVSSIQQQPVFPGKRTIDFHIPSLSSRVLPASHDIKSKASGKSSLKFDLDPRRSFFNVDHNIPPLPVTTKTHDLSASHMENKLVLPRKERCHELLSEFQYDVHCEGQEDALGMEELSALLPGSRKPLAPSVNALDRGLQSISLHKSSPKCEMEENTLFMNFNNSLQDLSEEEENNGSIKIVHFGVV